MKFSPGRLIPFTELIERVRFLAQKYPERKTKRMYWDYEMGCPECLVGTALFHFNVGVPLEWNTRSAFVLPWVKLGFQVPTEGQMRWLDLVQTAQDEWDTWGQAVEKADNVLLRVMS